MTIVKNSKILVNVEEALADLLVVSYSDDDRVFQGVLLDSKKGNLPFGVYALHPAFSKQLEKFDATSDKLYSQSQRYAYQELQYAKPVAPRSKTNPKQKMTVRLRPRKVLCSNCQGICNENNENVVVEKRTRTETSVVSSTAISDRRTLIPKLSRLKPSEIEEATDSKAAIVDKSEVWLKEPEIIDIVGSPPEAELPSEPALTTATLAPRTLKICFGQGEGTIVKIPSDSKLDRKARKKAKRSVETVEERKKRKRKHKNKNFEEDENQQEICISVQAIGEQTDPFEMCTPQLDENNHKKVRRRTDHLKSPTQ